MKKENVLKALKEHKPIIVNYGKGYLSNKDIKELATYDDTLNTYTSSTGVWSKTLLNEILNDKVEDVSLELVQ